MLKADYSDLDSRWRELNPRGWRRLYAGLKSRVNEAQATLENRLLISFAGHPIGERALDGVLFEPDGSRVVVAETLDSEALVSLIRDHTVCAIHVKGFCAPDIAARLSQGALREYSQWKLQGVPTDTFYAGGSVPQAVARSTKTDFIRYFREWGSFVDAQRSASLGQWPIDRLRIALDEAWPRGALLGSFSRSRARPGIMRLMFEDAVESPELGFIHTDQLEFVLSPKTGLFSGNVYLQMPPAGGEFHIWNIRQRFPRTPGEFVRQRYLCALLSNAFDLDAQEALRETLPPPITIKPEVGDLVLLDTARPHAVGRSRGGPRVSLQTFVQHSSDAPLSISA